MKTAGVSESAPADALTVDDLEQLRQQRWAAQQAEQKRRHGYYVTAAAEAKAHGELTTAIHLRLLSSHVVADAERLRLEMANCALALSLHRQSIGAKVRAKAAAAHKRPGRRPPIREVITSLMREQRGAGLTFQTFLRRWRAEALEGLRLAKLLPDGRYSITDENGDAAAVIYKRSYLEKLYSLSR